MINNIFDESIIIMSDMIQKNKGLGKGNRGFPISCVLWHDGEIVGKEVNQKNSTQSHGDACYHSEFVAINKLKVSGEITMIVTVPPCETCAAKMMEDTNIKWVVYYLNDEIRNKMDNAFWINFKSKGNKIKKMYISKLVTKESKLRFLYCVDTVINAFASHNNQDSKIIKSKRKTHKKRMREFFKSLRVSSGQIQTKWVFEFYTSNKICNDVK